MRSISPLLLLFASCASLPLDPADGAPPDGSVPSEDAPAAIDAPSAARLATGVTVDGLAVFQGVRVELARGGAAVTANAPVVAGRAAVVRAYLTVTGNRAVSGELTVFDGATPIATHTATATLSGSSDDARPGSVLAFSLPASEVTTSTRIALRIADPTGELATSAPHPARLPRDGTGLSLGAREDGAGLDLVLVPLRWERDGSGRLPDTSNPWLEQLRALLGAIYPIEDLRITVREPVPWNDALTLSGNVDFGAINGMLLDLRESDRAAPGAYYYALVAPDVSFSAYCGGSCVTGQSYVVEDPASDAFRVGSGVGFGTEGSAWTTVHEIGHEHGRSHAPCDTSPYDADYPYADGAIGVWGYDARSGTFLSPIAVTDFMGYCDEQWTSDYTWTAMFERTVAVSALSAGAPGGIVAPSQRYLVRIGGEIGVRALGVRAIDAPRTTSSVSYRFLDARAHTITFGAAPAITQSHTDERLAVLPLPPASAVSVVIDGVAIEL